MYFHHIEPWIDGLGPKVIESIINYFDENIDDVICSHIRLSHHTLHASHSFYDSGFGKALCIIIDGSGCYIPVGIKGTGPISDVVQYTRYGDSSLSDTTFATESRSAYLMEYPNKLNLVSREEFEVLKKIVQNQSEALSHHFCQ